MKPQGVRRAAVHRFADVSQDQVVPPDPQMAGIPVEVDPNMPPDTIEFRNREGETVGAITNLQTPLMPALTQGRHVTLQPTSVEDIDQLWDWSRVDREGVKAFLSIDPKNSRDLFTMIGRITNLQQQGLAELRSVRDGASLLGFVMLAPIARVEGKAPVGTVHIYLEPSVRGEIKSLLPLMLAEADRLVPGMSLAVITTRDEWARILQAVGFSAQIVLTRHAASGDTHGS